MSERWRLNVPVPRCYSCQSSATPPTHSDVSEWFATACTADSGIAVLASTAHPTRSREFSVMTTLIIRQRTVAESTHDILLTLKRPGKPDLEARAAIEFALTPQEQEELRWYMED